MPIIEITGLVTGIVSAFTGAYSLYQNRRNKADKAASLERSLTIGPSHVQGEYNRNFSRMGARFARGDDIARSALSAIVIDMQQKLLENMSQVIAGNSRGAGGYASLLRTSDNSRINAISALGEQYQRLAIEAPIAAPPCEHMAYCDVCNSGIHTVRYKCTKCPNYDMCSECFGSRRGRHNTHHQFRSIGSVPACGEQYENLGEEYDLGYQYKDPAPRREPVAYCDVCGSGIDGMRYKCTNCSDYDMCPACFRSNRMVHNTYHQFCSI